VLRRWLGVVVIVFAIALVVGACGAREKPVIYPSYDAAHTITGAPVLVGTFAVGGTV
jgi:hypothetical protein